MATVGNLPFRVEDVGNFYGHSQGLVPGIHPFQVKKVDGFGEVPADDPVFQQEVILGTELVDGLHSPSALPTGHFVKHRLVARCADGPQQEGGEP